MVDPSPQPVLTRTHEVAGEGSLWRTHAEYPGSMYSCRETCISISIPCRRPLSRDIFLTIAKQRTTGRVVALRPALGRRDFQSIYADHAYTLPLCCPQQPDALPTIRFD